MLLRSLPLALLLAPAALSQVQIPFTFGNLVVSRVGDGTAALSSNAAAIYLDEYTPAGVLVQSVALPVAASGANRPIAVRGTSSSEGFVSVSENGFYFMVAGYEATPGAAGFTGPATTNPRIVARVDIIGNVDTSTALTDAYSNGNIRAVASDNGQRFWISGTSLTEGGVRFVANVGDTTCVGINSGAPSNCRNVGIFDGQLYTTSASTVYLGVCTVGSNLPTTSGQPVTLLPGFPTTGGTAAQSAYDYYFANSTTLYVADDNTGPTADGGIQKWTLDVVTGQWSKQYTLRLTTGSGCRGLSGFTQNGVTKLWATTTGNELITVTDTGAASTVTSLAVATSNTALRGVRYVGVPSTLARLPASCGSADIKASGTGQIGTDVRTTIVNSQLGLGFIGYGLTPLGIPFCNCTVLHDFAVLLLGPSHTFPLPFDPTLIGTQVFIQGLDFLASGGCPDPLFTLTDGYVFTVQ